MAVIVEPRSGFGYDRFVVLNENSRLIAELSPDEWEVAGKMLTEANSVFVIGNGRSGLAAQMAAMRLMHLGLDVHVAGEITAPAVRAGDLLVAVSGSGATGSVVAASSTAKKIGAAVVAVTTAANSPLAAAADHVLVIPAADKQDHRNPITQQYAGSLFEQGVLLAFDALFQTLWRSDDQSAEALWSRHANLG